MKIKGIALVIEKPTPITRRVYGREALERELDKMQDKIPSRIVLGKFVERAEKYDSITDATHVITLLELRDDEVHIEAEILPTTKGSDLKSLIEAGIPLIFTVNGTGELGQANDDGSYPIKNDTYRLATIDIDIFRVPEQRKLLVRVIE